MALDMRYYIDRQPEAMRQTLDARRELGEAFARLWLEHGPDRLYLVGSGTSGNGVRAAAGFMQRVLDTEVTAVSPTSLPGLLRGKPMFVFVSQGGQSTNTVKAIEAMEAWPHLALTGEQDCQVNQVSPHTVLACEHEEAGPKTMGYTCTILTLYLMAIGAAVAAGRMTEAAAEGWTARFRAMADRTEENIAMTRRWLRETQAELLRAQSWAIAGVGTGREVASEAALKLQETILLPAAGFEYEEYLHGPTMMLRAEMGGLYLLPPEAHPDRPRMEALAEIHAGFGSPVLAVAAGKQAAYGGRRLTLAADEEECLAPFWQILPSQVMASELPEQLGTAGAGSRIFRMIDEAVGVKCPKE